jgi:signal transduction histidine kinase
MPGRAAWALCAVTALLVAVAVLFAARNGTDPRSLGHLLFVVVSAVVAALIETGRPGHAAGRLMAVGGFAFALMEACGEYALYRPDTVLGTMLAWPQTWLWVPANTAFALIPLMLPWPSRRWRPVVLGVVAAGAVTAVVHALRPGVNTQVGSGVVNPLGVPALAGAADVAEQAFVASLCAVMVAGTVALLVRAVRAGAEGRRWLRWLAYAAAADVVIVAGRLAAGLTDADAGSIWPRDSYLWEYAGAVGAALPPLAIGATVLWQRSLEQVMAAREEERRRIRRDLHDGLGPALAALSMRAEAAQELVRDDAAKRLLDEIIADAETAVAGVRTLVDGLRPPVLDTLGLLGALEAHAAAEAGPAVQVRAPHDLPPLPAAAETAAYRIAVEALANARRHAAASRVWITLEAEAGLLRLEVADDGRGIGPARPGGVGLTSMRERAAELGGTCTIEPRRGGGTVVRALLPATGGAG